MKRQFAQWLKNNGYSLLTAEGRPSTIYDYGRGLKKVMDTERLSIEEVAQNIDSLLPKYQYGARAAVGRSISRSCRSSLAQFYKFVKEQEVA